MAKIALNDVGLRSLKPPAKGQQSYWDKTLPSFGVRVSQGGSKTFVLNRGNSLITIGRFPVLTLAKARAEAKRLLAEFTLGRTSPYSPPYAEAVEEFLTEKGRAKRERTVADYRRLLGRLRFRGKVGDITHQEAAREINKFDAPSERDHILVAAKVFFNWCAKRHYLEKNPASGLSTQTIKSRSRVLSDAELQLIWRACERSLQETACELELGVWPACRPSTIESTGEKTEPRHFGSITNTTTSPRSKSDDALTCGATTPATKSVSGRGTELSSTPTPQSQRPTKSTKMLSSRANSNANLVRSAEINERRDTTGTTYSLSMSTGSARSTTKTSIELGCRQTGDSGAGQLLGETSPIAAPRLPAHFATIVKLLILTGQRKSEIANLRTDYFSCLTKPNLLPDTPVPKAHVVASTTNGKSAVAPGIVPSSFDLCTLPATATKNGREHTFPLGSCATILLSELEASSGLFFPSRHASRRPFSGWSKSKAALDKLSGVTDWTLHDLRRTYASNMARLGVPLHIIEKLLNHVSGSFGGIVGVYQRHQYLDEMREAVNKYEAWLGALCGIAQSDTLT